MVVSSDASFSTLSCFRNWLALRRTKLYSDQLPGVQRQVLQPPALLLADIMQLLPQSRWAVAPQTGCAFRNRRPRGTYFCNLAFMLSSFAAVMTFGCRPPVSHGPAANAARAAGPQPRLRSVGQPPLLVYAQKVIYKIFLPAELNWSVLFLSGSHFQTLRTQKTGADLHLMWKNIPNLLM